MDILEQISLKSYNTFGLDVKAQHFCAITSKEDIEQLIKKEWKNFHRHLILGGGSNVLLCKDVEGLVIKNNIIGIEILKEDENNVWVKSYSGTTWHDVVLFCVDKGWYGIENLSLIPGTIGAAPIQNIGAYGAELKDVFVELEAIDLETASTKIFTKEQCQFGYRDSIFKHEAKGKYFIFSVTLKLSKQPNINIAYGDIQKVLEEKNIQSPNAKNISDAVIQIRESKLPNPKDLGNAGSFFKNPEITTAEFNRIQQVFPQIPKYDLANGNKKIPAAWLIEQCGWKGKRIGETGNHTKQALVLVNYGNAKGNEIWQHALHVQQSVQEKFGILLEPEVNVIQ